MNPPATHEAIMLESKRILQQAKTEALHARNALQEAQVAMRAANKARNEARSAKRLAVTLTMLFMAFLMVDIFLAIRSKVHKDHVQKDRNAALAKENREFDDLFDRMFQAMLDLDAIAIRSRSTYFPEL